MPGLDSLICIKGDITLVHGNHWHAVYIDGKLIAEDNCLDAVRILEILGIPFDSKVVDFPWLENRGRYPVELKDVMYEPGE